MKQSKKKSAAKIALSLALVTAMLTAFGTTAFAGTFAENINFQEQIKLDDVIYDTHYYTEYLEEQKGNFSDVEDATISIDVNNYTSFEGKEPEIKSLEGKDNVLYVDIDNKSISWDINVEKAGYYQFKIEYLPVDGNSLAVSRGIMIDGKYLYDELETIKFLRHWVDAEKPRVNNLGDEVRPSQLEIQEWITTNVHDSQGEYSLPLKVGLTEGKHTITMVTVDQPIAISAFGLEEPTKLKTYSEVLAEYKQNGYKNATSTIRFEAENKDFVNYKTENTITISNSSDSTLTPVGITSKRYNYIGGDSWGKGTETIEWKFEVKESGLYKIAPRFIQAFGNGFTSTRQIMIDGKIPYAEFNEMEFTYDTKWTTKSFMDKDGNPYLIYLEKGTHTISMRSVMGRMTEVIHKVSDITSRLSNAIRNITMITGQEPDINYDYRLEEQIPSLIPDLNTVSDELKECVKLIDEYAIKTTPIENNFVMSYELIDEIIKKPLKIPAKLADISSTLTSVGTWLNDIKKHAFGLDYIQFVAPDAEVINEKSTFWDSLKATILTFILSYTKDYSAIGYFGEDAADYETIEVWISRGKEQAEMIKGLTDLMFTTKHKINVTINVLPAGALGGGTSPLLLAINAGTEPDVCLAIEGTVPTDYAVRGATYNLKNFDDFEETMKYTYPVRFLPLTYEGGVYGLPETISFQALFYRTDIFEQLDLKVPDTWDEIVDTLLPQLYQYNMQFGMTGAFEDMLYQSGARYYSDTCYSSTIATPKFLEAYSTYVKMFTDYGCPVAASNLNRFRSGEMPIHFGSIADYMNYAFAAPELVGKWKMAVVPGTKKADGTVDRSYGAVNGAASIILSTSDKLDEAWTFVKWYNSYETQVALVSQNESLFGVGNRILPANTEAFWELPWTNQERQVIQTCFENAKSQPAALGGYFTSRYMSTVYTNCVTQGANVREELEKAAEAINKELRRKQIMYGVNPEGKF